MNENQHLIDWLAIPNNHIIATDNVLVSMGKFGAHIVNDKWETKRGIYNFDMSWANGLNTYNPTLYRYIYSTGIKLSIKEAPSKLDNKKTFIKINGVYVGHTNKRVYHQALIPATWGLKYTTYYHPLVNMIQIKYGNICRVMLDLEQTL